MSKNATLSGSSDISLLLGRVPIKIEWQAPPEEDVLARLLLKLIGEDNIKDIFDE